MANQYRDFDDYFKHYPDAKGYFGEYGGSVLPPQLVPAFEEIDKAYRTIAHSAKFVNELLRGGEPSPWP